MVRGSGFYISSGWFYFYWAMDACMMRGCLSVCLSNCIYILPSKTLAAVTVNLAHNENDAQLYRFAISASDNITLYVIFTG